MTALTRPTTYFCPGPGTLLLSSARGKALSLSPSCPSPSFRSFLRSQPFSLSYTFSFSLLLSLRLYIQMRRVERATVAIPLVAMDTNAASAPRGLFRPGISYLSLCLSLFLFPLHSTPCSPSPAFIPLPRKILLYQLC